MLFNLVEYGTPLISLFSIFLFLPLSLIGYYLVSVKHREKALLMISVIFFFFVAPRQIVFILILVLINYLLASEIKKAPIHNRAYRSMLLLINLLVNLGFWIVFSFTKDFKGYPYILGGAVVPFLLMGTNVLIYKNKIENIPSLLRYSLYALFFPRLFVGPFNSIIDFDKGLGSDIDTMKTLKNGGAKFVRGSVQFIFLGTRLITLAETINSFEIGDATKLSAWIMVVALALGIYHTLAGISLVVEGIGDMFGLQLPSGWNHPYTVKTVIRFGRSFHGSLEDYFWRNLSVWSINKKYRGIIWVVTALIVGAMVGLWVDFSIGFFIWGMMIAGFAVIEFFLLKKYFDRGPSWVGRIYTGAAIVVSFAFLAIGYNGWNTNTAKLLFGLQSIGKSQTAYYQIEYYLRSYWFLIALALFFATDISRQLAKLTNKTFPNTQRFISGIIDIALSVVLITLII